MEAKVQKEITQFLKKKGCLIIKTKPGVLAPVGTPDIFFFLEGFWGCIEVKRSAKAPYQPLQKETIAKLSDWSYARVAYPENVHEILLELDDIL